MTLSLTLSAKTEAKLRQCAAAGQEPAAYASQVLEHAISHPSLDELLAPLRAEFARSGTSDEELVAQITEARDACRNQR